MRASQKLISAIKRFEGVRFTAYQDVAGVWTIGYGHTEGVKAGQHISYAVAENYLYKDLSLVEEQVDELGDWTQGQFDALVDFAFNLGVGALKRSTLLKYIRERRGEAEIRAEFAKWRKAGGKVCAGLVKRRAWEAQRFYEND